MKSLEESVVQTMDGESKRLFQFLPFIMQDLWEFGSSPSMIVNLVRRHTPKDVELKVLDLGCGKGAVSVHLAHELKCSCLGIDAVKEFIGEAKIKAKEWKVDHLCNFETGDIRSRVKELDRYDVILLGSIGYVLGDYLSTLSLLNDHLNENGIIIVDDGYIEDGNDFSHPGILKKSIILKQIEQAQMELIDEFICDRYKLKNSDEYLFEKIVKRCNQLIEMYPDDSQLFLDYIIKQQEENEILERKVTCSAMVIMKKS